MLPSASNARRGQPRHLLAALIFAVGCSSTGSSCGSCSGLATTLPDGGAFKYTGSKLDNTVQVRLTDDLFNQLDATTLNQVIGGLNSNGSFASLPCFSDTLVSYSTGCGLIPVTQLAVLAGDENFDAQCTSADSTPLYLTFNDVAWTLDPTHQVLHMQLFVNIKSGDFYVRSAEAHSSIYRDSSGNPAPFQADIQIDDSENLSGQTELDLDLQFTRAPDGRLLVMPTQASLAALLQGVDITGMIHIASTPGDMQHPNGNPVPPALGSTDGYNGCDADNTRYQTMNGPQLTGSGWTVLVGSSCTPNSTSEAGIGCQIFQFVEQELESILKTTFQTQLVNLLQQQIDNLVCVRPTDSTGAAVACGAGHLCPPDDDGNPTTCDTTYSVCLAKGQANASGTGLTDAGTALCEPNPLALQGSLDPTALTGSVGFPAGTKVNFYAGLGGKTAADTIDDGGVQLSAVSGTQPASTVVPSLCVPPTTFPPIDANNIPAINFDDPANQPDGGVGTYDVGFAVASQLLNRASYDAFNAGVFCLEISNKTSSLVSTSLVKTFLPSLGLLTHGADVPLAILFRPTGQPSVRIGKGTLAADGTISGAADPLITLKLPALALDFYAVIDERWVRLFTVTTDVDLPLGLRTFAGNGSDQLQPVLGDLSMLLSNITASNNTMLAEDPAVLTQLLSAVISFVQPLLSSVLTAIKLPAILGLQLQVKGIDGAIPFAGDATGAQSHLAIWAAISPCGGASQPPCANRSTRTEARLVESDLPASAEEIRVAHKVPAAIIEAHAGNVRQGEAEFSYRIDGGLWSPWNRSPRIEIRSPMFYVQGHHRIEVTSRESGNDRSQDREPVSVDFYSSYEAPTASLVQLSDGRIVTRAKSQASPTDRLRFSYRVGSGGWSTPGPMRDYSPEALGESSLSVRVSDERGLTSTTAFGETEARN